MLEVPAEEVLGSGTSHGTGRRTGENGEDNKGEDEWRKWPVKR